MSGLGRISIRTNGHESPNFWEVWLGETDISKFVRGFDLAVRVGELPLVTLELVGELDIPDAILAAIENVET